MQAWKCQSNILNVILYVRILLTIKIVYRLNVSIYHDQLLAEPTTTIPNKILVIKDTTWLLLVNLFVLQNHIWLFLLEEGHKP
jgi:hypothetical protein